VIPTAMAPTTNILAHIPSPDMSRSGCAASGGATLTHWGAQMPRATAHSPGVGSRDGKSTEDATGEGKLGLQGSALLVSCAAAVSVEPTTRVTFPTVMAPALGAMGEVCREVGDSEPSADTSPSPPTDTGGWLERRRVGWLVVGWWRLGFGSPSSSYDR
jgi:hypothetical protein